ncbi:MAG: OsmC family protein [Spirochaetia bacterium]|jgi:organic hydroperoxide reductase OsmC/OhrA
MSAEHLYALHLTWEGNLGAGTSSYRGYGRQWRARVQGKPDLVGTADPAFRGEKDSHNPEDLLVASLSSCHMLTYLALCARNGISVLSYFDDASGVMKTTPDGGGRFESVTLRPAVEIAESGKQPLAMELHEKAHALCFIAASVNFPVHNAAVVTARG